MNEFLDKIVRIETELDRLHSFAYDISQMYNKDIFPEQTHLSSDKLENLIISVTHETASEIGFLRNDIENLAGFIEFREKYREFSDNELAEILETNVPVEQKRNFSHRFYAIKDMIKRIDELKRDWNAHFHNRDYSAIKKQLGI